MQYASPDIGFQYYVELGEFFSKDWGKCVDLYAIARPPQEYPAFSPKAGTFTYFSLGARFSDDPGDYHSVPCYIHNMIEGSDTKDFDKFICAESIDGVREALLRLIALGLVKDQRVNSGD